MMMVMFFVLLLNFGMYVVLSPAQTRPLIHQYDGIFEPATFRANAHPATLGVGSEISGLDSSWTPATSRIHHPCGASMMSMPMPALLLEISPFLGRPAGILVLMK